MTITSKQLRTLVTAAGTLELSLVDVEIPDPGPDEVIVKVEATPLNPSDLMLLFGPADMSTAKASGNPGRPIVTADIPKELMRIVTPRIGESLAVGNEGAGVVVAAGSSDAAQALMGKTVGMVGGEMYAEFRAMNAMMCLELEQGTTAAEGASCFVNPLTVLGMVDTMRGEGHTALVHTAAASNLGQMLNRICQNEDIDLVNIVRKPEQETLLREQGAKYICNSSSDSFEAELTEALIETNATIAFDATGGGKLANQILSAMEAAAAKRMSEYNRYGSDVFKQVYIYGGLDISPTVLSRNFGFAWSVSGWLLTQFLAKAGLEKLVAMRSRVAAEISTTFASHYTQEISLEEVLSLTAISQYNKRATGTKYLIKPHM